MIHHPVWKRRADARKDKEGQMPALMRLRIFIALVAMAFVALARPRDALQMLIDHEERCAARARKAEMGERFKLCQRTEASAQ